MSRYRRLLRYLRPYRGVFVISTLAASIASVLDGLTFALLIPFLRMVFGLGGAVGDTPTLVERIVLWVVQSTTGLAGAEIAPGSLVIVILAAVVLKNAAAYLAAWSSAWIEETVTRDLRHDLFRALLRRGLRFFARTRSGQLLSRMAADVEQIHLLLANGLQTVLRNGVLILVYLAILFGLSVPLATVTLVLVALTAGIMRPLLVRIGRRHARALETRGEVTSLLQETVAGIRAVKASRAESTQSGRFDALLDRYVRNMLRSRRLALLAHPLSETVGATVFVVLLTAGTWLATGGGSGMRPELFVAFLAVTLRLLPPVKKLAHFPALAAQALVAADRVIEVIDAPPEDVDRPGTQAFPGLREALAFDDVWFAYEPGRWVLQGVTFSVRRGEVVALVGPSGAGKSTLLDLLPRFIDPDRGAVKLDGVPTTRYSRTSLRTAMAIVSQETILFNDTVAANIAFGMEGAPTREAVQRAARLAHAHEFILRLPAGYETLVGERGVELSGGERQRLAMARALLADAPILILDEATSALDGESERLVQDAIEHLLAHRTVLVIAHRLSTVGRADRIVVLEGGRVRESGSHEQLVRAGGLYQHLHEVGGR